MSIKDLISTLFFIGFIIFFIWCFCAGIADMVKKADEKQKQTEEYIQSCIDSGGRIEQIGNWYTKNYLVCYGEK